MGYIYCITNLINSKRYIGKTSTTIEERWLEHCKDSRKERCNKRPLYDAFNKYGIENFKIESLEEVEDINQLSDREVYWINELKTYGHNGYNASKGGDGTILYDHNEILELANLGYTTDLISKKLGCYRQTIYKVLRAHGIKARYASSKLIALYDLAGNYIQTFWGSNNAAEWLVNNGITNSKKSASNHVIECCNGKYKSSYEYIWKYLPEPEI